MDAVLHDRAGFGIWRAAWRSSHQRIAGCDPKSRPEVPTMKGLLLTVTVTAAALALAATGLAVGDAKNESPFTQSLAVAQIHSSKAQLTGNEALHMRSEALNLRYHLGDYAATGSAPNYQAVKERI
jgi:hypothetical protein